MMYGVIVELLPRAPADGRYGVAVRYRSRWGLSVGKLSTHAFFGPGGYWREVLRAFEELRR